MFAPQCLRVEVLILAVALDLAVLVTLMAVRQRADTKRVHELVTSPARVTALIAPSNLLNLAAAALIACPLKIGATAPCQRTAETAEAAEGGRCGKCRHRAKGRGAAQVTKVREEQRLLNRVPTPQRPRRTGEFVGAEELADSC